MEDLHKNAAAQQPIADEGDSYVCNYCGKINKLTELACEKCGKRKPRNPFIVGPKKAGAAQYLSGMAQSAQTASNNHTQNLDIERIVQMRVAEELGKAHQNYGTMREQDLEDVKKFAAREAVLRVIAAEDAADMRVEAAERKANDMLAGRNDELNKIIDAEKDKVITAAARKIVAERAGIEDAAQERMEAYEKQAERAAQNAAIQARDEAERAAARKAVVQIIAAEKANDDRLRMTKDAVEQAAAERIEAEKELAQRDMAAKFGAERLAVERAADERIKAERERLGMGGIYAGGVGGASSFGITPMVNPNQPLHQYNPNLRRTVFRFVPDNGGGGTGANFSGRRTTAPRNQSVGTNAYGSVNKKAEARVNTKNAERPKKVKAVREAGTSQTRLFSIFAFVFSLAIILLATVTNEKLGILYKTDFSAVRNIDVLQAFFSYLINAFPKVKLPVSLADNEFYLLAMLTDKKAVMVPVGFTFLVFCAFVTAVGSLIEAITKRASMFNAVMTVFVFLSFIAAVFGVLLFENWNFNALFSTGMIVTIIASLLLGITLLIAEFKRKKAK